MIVEMQGSTASTEADQTTGSFAGQRVAFVGRLGGVNRRQAQQLVRDQGGMPVERAAAEVDIVVIGADELPLVDQEELLDEPTRTAAAAGKLQIITETQFWQQLGLVDPQQHIHRLYTPAMLAALLRVPVSVVRRWHRRGLIVPVREVHRLPYFAFEEIATARRLAELMAAGASPAAIERKLAELARYVPQVERPLAQLSVLVEGRQILLRQGEGLIEPGGQLRIDFAAAEDRGEEFADSPQTRPLTLPMIDPLSSSAAEDAPASTPEELYEVAIALEEEGRIAEAADTCRAVLVAGGPRAEVCFMLAELLYRLGDLSAARERYYMAIELDEDFVEARANLGCVLAETGQLELAVAAFDGALRYHAGFPDVHYHLARTLDELHQPDEARRHWQEFLRLAPNSPWADEAALRLS